MADSFALANAFVRIRPTTHGFRAEADEEIKRELAGLGPTVKLNASTKLAKEQVRDLQVYIKQLADRSYNIRLNTDDKAAQAKLTRMYGQLLKLDSQVVSPRLTLRGFTRMQAELLQIDAALDMAANAAEGAGKKASLSGRGWDSLWRSLGKAIPLAGGLFGHIAVWHLLLDALVEIIAVWAAAAVAVGAFAVAAIKASVQVATHVRSMGIVMSATNAIIPPMTGNFRKLQTAIQPRVYQIFGAALAVMAHQGSAFSTVAMGAGHVLDVFAARLANALTQGHGMGRFLRGAVPTLNTLGESFAALGVIIGNIFKALPGFAEMLLEVGTELLKIGAAITSFLEPALKIIFWLHGAIVWGGLAATVMLKLGRAFLALKGVKVLSFIATFVADLITMTLTMGVTTAATYAYTEALAALQDISPLGWVAIAAVAFAGLILIMKHAKTAATEFGEAMQKRIMDAPVTEALQRIQDAQVQTTARLTTARQQLARSSTYLANSNQAAWRSFHGLNSQQIIASGNVKTYRSQLTTLTAQLKTGRDHVQALSRAYGGNVAAQGLLVAAGVTTDQLLSSSATDWAIVQQMVEDTARAYKFMGASGTVLSNDMEVLDQQASAQVEAVQKLNQAWDAFIQGVTAGQQTFDTFSLGLATLRRNWDQSTKSALSSTHTVNGLKVKFDVAHAAMDGLSKASLTVNQAFATQVQNATDVINALRSASIGGHEFKRAIKDIVVQMLPFAKGSEQATAQLFALAEEAGIKGPASFANLVRWTGKTHDAQRDLKKIMNDATIQASLLTAALDDQAKFIRNQLLGAINSAIVKYSGVMQAATNYGKAVAGSGKSSDEARGKFQTLTEKMFDAELQMHKSRDAALRVTAAILGIPKSRVLHILERGVGRFTINGALPGGVPQPGTHPKSGAASGLFVTTGSGPTADDNLVRVSKGELIVPANMVSAGAVDHLRGAIPGFAAGGLVQQGGASVLSGKAIVDFDKRFVNQLTDSMKRSMTAAMKQAINEARSSFGAPGGLGGPTSAGARAAIAYAASRLAAYGWGQSQMRSLIPLWMGESGWNRLALNAKSGAYGIPQALPASKMGPEANPPISSAAAQINWGLGYIKGRYGSPAGAYSAWLSRNPHWYAAGTAGAMPGWAVVGEDGPELVKMTGGETVLPAGITSMAMGGLVRGYKKGVGLSVEVDRALRMIRKHPFAPDRQNRLTGILDHVLGRIHGERSLLRLPGLAKWQRANLLHHLHHDERRRKWLLHELEPVRHHIRVVNRAERHLRTRMRDLRAGIHYADRYGYTRIEDMLRGRLAFRKYQLSELEDWAHYPRPRVVNRETRRHAHNIIESVLSDMGLPTAGFDKGGYLMPGATLAVNGLGRPEPVGAQPVQIVMQTRGGQSDFDRFMHNWIVKHVDFHGGGDVQVTFGSKHY